MEKELYMPPCCIDKKLPPMMRSNEGRMVQFYSQGDWGLPHLWRAASSLVSHVLQDDNGDIKHIEGTIHTLLIVQNIDNNLLKLVEEYARHRWIDHIVVIAHTSTIDPVRYAEFVGEFKESVIIRIGQRAAALSPLWLRYDTQSYNALLVSGPMFSSNKLNPTFAAYTATFFDRHKDGTVNEEGKALVDMTAEVWREMTGLKL